MRFHEIREFTVPGIALNEGVPGTDPVTGKPLGVKTPGIWDTIKGLFPSDDKPGSGIGRLNPLNPLKNIEITQPFKGFTHNGVDLRAAVGTPVYAPEDGVVKQMKGFRAGLYIELHTSTGVHRLMHLSKYSVEDGAKVRAGTEIAKSGNTGVLTGPHLHWEYWVDGKAIDPMATLKEGALADIAGKVWKKVAGTAEKELPRTEPKPTSTTPTPIRDPDQTPRPTPVYTTPKPTPVAQLSPFRGLISSAESAGIKLMPLGDDKIVQLGGRPIVVVDVGGRTVPFYVSTGGGGKAGVPTGKWYPFFGIGKNGFFNKGWEEAQINNYYGNQTLAHVARTLDNTFGNVLGHVNRMNPGQPVLGQINAGFKPVSYSDSAPFSREEFAAYQKYINSIVDSI